MSLITRILNAMGLSRNVHYTDDRPDVKQPYETTVSREEIYRAAESEKMLQEARDRREADRLRQYRLRDREDAVRRNNEERFQSAPSDNSTIPLATLIALDAGNDSHRDHSPVSYHSYSHDSSPSHSHSHDSGSSSSSSYDSGSSYSDSGSSSF